jgi:hypothetical protein
MKKANRQPKGYHPPASGKCESGMVLRNSICCKNVPKKLLPPLAISFKVRWRFDNKMAEIV